MKQLVVKKIDINIKNAEELSHIFYELSIPFNKIDTINWETFPYCPDVSFRIAHNGDAVFLNYHVNESDIKAVCDEDNGRVWEDSCVEFFVSFNEESYINIECNCIGKILIGKGAVNTKRIHLQESILKTVDRWSSVGYNPVEGLSGEWEVSLIIPKEIFHPELKNTFNKLEANGNFYKCGDRLQTPHFVSWNPVYTEKPSFHRPDFFGKLIFE